MASGKRVYEGSVAYNQLPLGTKIEIDGINYYVEDRCAYDNVIDIYMNLCDYTILKNPPFCDRVMIEFNRLANDAYKLTLLLLSNSGDSPSTTT